MRMIAAEFESAGDFQEVLDRARLFASEQQFLIGVRVLTGTISAAQAGGAYALLAECIDRGHAGRGGARDGAGARPRARRRRGRRRHGQARRARDDGRLRSRSHPHLRLRRRGDACRAGSSRWPHHAVLYAPDPAPDQRLHRADRRRHRSTRSTCACGPPARRGRWPRSSRASSTTRPARPGPGSTWR